MASDNVLGSVSIIIQGDTSQLPADFAKGVSAAQTAGAQISGALNDAMAPGMRAASGLLDQFGRAIQVQVIQPVKAAIPVLTQFQRAALDVAAAESAAAAGAEKMATAHTHAVSEIQATSGALRTLEGTGGIRAAERFLATTLGLGGALQTIFPVIGAIAFAEQLVRVGEEIAKLAKGADDTQGKLRDAFRELNTGAQESNESLQVANDKLENEIAKIEKKPENGIKLALDEAILSATQLGRELDKDLDALRALAAEHQVSILGEVFGKAPTSDIENELKAFQRRIADINAKSAIPRQETLGGVALFSPELLEKQKIAAQIETNTALAKAYREEIENLNHQLKTAEGAPTNGAVDAAQRIEILTGAIANLKRQSDAIDLKTAAGNLAGQHAGAQAKADAARLEAEAAKKADEAWQYQKRVFEEAQKAAVRYQDALDAAANKLYALTQRVAVSNRELADGFARAADKYAESRARIEAADAKKLFEPKPNIEQTPIGVSLQQRLGGTAIGNGLSVSSAGLKTAQEQQAAIEQQQKTLALATQINVPIGEQLRLRESILRAQIALAEAEGKDASSQLIALRNLQDQEAAMRRRSAGAALLYGNLKSIGQQSPGQLGGALASGAVGGNIGQQIKGALQGIGKEILGTLFTAAIEKLVVELGINTAATAALNAIFGVSATTQVTATTANTIAITANTTALAAHGVASAASAGVGAAASAAGAASSAAGAAASGLVGPLISAAGGVIGGLISAFATWIGDNKIVKAINGTTAAVLALHGTVSGSATTGNAAATPSVLSGASQGGFAGFFSSILGIGGAKPVDVNIVGISPLSPLKGLFNLFGFAAGGRPPVGVASIVGEKGPELFIPDQAGQVIAAGKFGAASAQLPQLSNVSRSSSSVVGSHTFNVYGNGNPMAVTRAIAGYLKNTSQTYAPYSH